LVLREFLEEEIDLAQERKWGDYSRHCKKGLQREHARPERGLGFLFSVTTGGGVLDSSTKHVFHTSTPPSSLSRKYAFTYLLPPVHHFPQKAIKNRALMKVENCR